MANSIERKALELALTKKIEEKRKIAKDIFQIAYESGIYPYSINDFYMARGKGAFGGFTVPAINLRTMTFYLASAIFRAAKKINAGAFIFEVAKSEMGYTDQPPIEYTSMCLAAAVKEGYSGPVFIQGDHFQFNHKKFSENPKKEEEGIKAIILDSINSGFYNIDIDSSTLVDLSRTKTIEQQELNYKMCAEMTNYIRQIQPAGIEVSVGGEIGEVGGKNSTPEELRAFMEGYKKEVGQSKIGISKISIQTGTSHGGVVLPDGKVAKVKLDFDTLKNLSKLAREEFGMAGAVQHGASTLPDEAFGKFPEMEAAEVHLATQFQNIVYESKAFPEALREKIYGWLKKNAASERKEGQTEKQFLYKTRKKALGAFKKDILELPDDVKEHLTDEVGAKFEFLFNKLNIAGTKDSILKYAPKKPVKIQLKEEHVGVHLDGEGDD
ncbi:MAG: class II fructose-bisphosphate aldolase [Candidatus Omnitrophica bacterium]|nr:class II fructose-bisphosphate aldolase [Candidatus Omnitrophota bacterium]